MARTKRFNHQERAPMPQAVQDYFNAHKVSEHLHTTPPNASTEVKNYLIDNFFRFLGKYENARDHALGAEYVKRRQREALESRNQHLAKMRAYDEQFGQELNARIAQVAEERKARIKREAASSDEDADLVDEDEVEEKEGPVDYDLYPWEKEKSKMGLAVRKKGGKEKEDEAGRLGFGPKLTYTTTAGLGGGW